MEGNTKTLTTVALVTGAVAGGCLLFRAYHQQQLHQIPGCQPTTITSSRCHVTPADQQQAGAPEELQGLRRVLSPTRSLTLGWQAVTGALQQLLGSPTRAQLPAVSYEWAQSAEEVLLRVAVPSDTTRHQVTVAVDPQQLAVLRDEQLLLGGCLQHGVVPALCHWHLDTHEQPPQLVVTLAKAPPGGTGTYPLWTHLLGPQGPVTPHTPPRQVTAAGPGDSHQETGDREAGCGRLGPSQALSGGSAVGTPSPAAAPPPTAATGAAAAAATAKTPVRQPRLVVATMVGS